MKLFFRKYGNGPYLIILHGLYGSSDNWVTIAKSVSNRFTVILPDQRNHGLSPHSEIHNYGAMASDLLELVEELQIEKFILAGHSMGGKTAMNFALKWPERLNGLLIADITPFAAGENSMKEFRQHQDILNAIMSAEVQNVSDRNHVEALLEARIQSVKIRGVVMKNLKRNSDMSFAWKINPLSLLNNLNNIMGEIDLRKSESNPVSGFPVVFLKGECSGYISTGEYEKIRAVFPSAEFFEVPGAGHWIHADRPDVVVSHLLSF